MFTWILVACLAAVVLYAVAGWVSAGRLARRLRSGETGGEQLSSRHEADQRARASAAKAQRDAVRFHQPGSSGPNPSGP
ncbi:hypothetical protein [Nocardioides sp. Leaf374]|uniref:hypothetical protein n=1 Tax=Nocardioides sp. Leaf374 TaxID=2876560 RepID=UPI001E3EA786|nr:hypothetical protein [Nocardioides sp. Leaf374]